jgi:AraC family transcriptional regulator
VPDTAALDESYDQRIARVIEYIWEHLDEPLPLEHLSGIAGFSRFHFHRQFSAHAGFTVAQFVRLARLKRAAYMLAFEPTRSLMDVALDAGFSAPESFARAFKEVHGQTPGEFRRTPQWASAADYRRLPAAARSNSMQPTFVDFATTRVAVLEHRGSPDTLLGSVSRFIAWRRACNDSPVASSRTFGVAWDDPRTTPPEQFRFDICGELHGALSPNDARIIEKTIPGGRCAVARHIGSTDAIARTVIAMYRDWLPQSGEKLRDYPCFFQYIKRMPAVPEHEQVTDVFLPLR